jgi:hypothetical protein
MIRQFFIGFPRTNVYVFMFPSDLSVVDVILQKLQEPLVGLPFLTSYCRLQPLKP